MRLSLNIKNVMPTLDTTAPAASAPYRSEHRSPHPTERRPWIRLAAIGGFLFFLVKGLVWLAVVGAAIFQIAT